jgi:hypothetical protein
VKRDVTVIGTPVAFALSASDDAVRPKTTPGIWRNITLLGRLGPLSSNPIAVEAVSTHPASVWFKDLDRRVTRRLHVD